MKKSILIFAMIFLPLLVWSYDGEEFIDEVSVINQTGRQIVKMLFRVTNEEKGECEVICVTDHGRFVSPSIFEDASIEGVLEIPETATKTVYVNGKKQYPYTVIGLGSSALQSCPNLTSAVIPITVTYIGHQAFCWCSSLKSIEIPQNVEVIDDSGAFYECTALESVQFSGTKMKSIGDYTFSGCKSLKEIELPEGLNSIGENAFENCEALTTIRFPQNSLISIGFGAFNSCKALNGIEFPEGLVSIGGSSYHGCTALESIVIPNSVTTLESGAFMDCTSLTYADIGDGVKCLSEGLFYNCSNLRVLKIGKGIEENKGSFSGNTSLEDITIDCTLDPEHEIIFPENESIKKLTFGDNVRSIGGIYDDYPNLESVWIGKSVCSIKGLHDSPPFSYCPNLKSIIISKENTTYDSRNNCNAIIETTTNTLVRGINTTIIQDGITCIGKNAFTNCYDMTSITIPSSVMSIDVYAFYNCSGLLDVYCYADNVPTTEYNAFTQSNIENATLHVPAGSVSDYQAASPWNQFKEIVAISDVTIGDANGDGVVDVADVVEIVNFILEKPSGSFVEAAADANDDKVIDAADVVAVVNIILKGGQ